jgi:quinol monooxygenase YgiN
MSTMLVVGRIAGLAGRIGELRELLAGHARDVRGEPGCVGYDVAELLAEEPATFLMVQTWSSAEAMRAHFATPAHATYQHDVGELLARPSEVVIHTVESTTRPSPSTSPVDPGRFG